MRIPEKLLFEGKEVAHPNGFSYETPWASACPEFIDNSIPIKLDSLSKFRAYDQELEDMGPVSYTHLTLPTIYSV